MSANPRDIPTMRMVVGSTSERYTTSGDISFGLIRYNTTDNNVEAYAKDGWVNLQGGGVGSDASLSSIVEYTDNSGITFLSDVSVNGVLNSTDGSFSGNLYSTSGIIGGAGGWILGANGNTNYIFTGSGLTGSVSNPTLNLFRGNKYIFINNTGGHPFQISNSDNTAYGSGVTNNGGVGGSTITFEVPHDAPKTLKYICTSHAGAMNGVINIHGGGSAVDASFQNDVTIAGNLYVDGSFNFGEVIQNITTVNNELLISTQVDISNYGTGPALSVTQHGDGAADNLLLLHAGTDGSAVEVKGDGKSIFYKDVSINTQLIVPDASFNRIAPIDGSLVIMGDLSVNGQIFSSGGLVGGGGGSGTDASFNVIDEFLDGSGVTFLTDVSINGDLKNSGFADLSNKVFLNTVTTTFNTGTIVDLSDVVTAMSTKFTADDASFYRIAPIDGSLVLIGDLSVNGNIFSSGGIVGGGGGSGSGTDASFNVIGEFIDDSRVTFISDVSINSQLSVPDASINNINAVDGTGVTIEQVVLNNNNVTANTIYASNYAVGSTNFVSASRQGNFRDLELKSSNNVVTVLMDGDTGNIDTDGILSTDTINEKTTGTGITIDSVLIKNNEVTATKISATNYDLGSHNIVSAARQAKFTGLELKNSSTNALTVLMEGDTGDIETTGIIKVDTIDDYTDGSGVTFLTDVSINEGLSAVDASFQNDITVGGNLYVDGSFNFGEVIKNITTVNNELLISTQVDISNVGTGPALRVAQFGDTVGDKLAVFDATGPDGVALEIMHDGDSVFYKDVSFHKNVVVRDASFINDVDVDGTLLAKDDVSFNKHLSVLDASFQNDVDIYGNLVLSGDISINGELIYGGFADISNKVFLNTVTTTFNTGTIVDLSDVVTAMGTQLTTHDASFQNNVDISGNLSIASTGALTVPVGTFAQQPTGVMGMVRFNSSFKRLEFYSGNSWRSIESNIASGGQIVDISGYRVHTFTTSDTFTVVNRPERIDYLIVAGGGGGTDGDDNTGGGGGGGAGGFVELTNIPITPGSYNVIVGAGGGGSILNQSSSGQGGSYSAFNGTSAIGGGAGGGGTGGSGGGGFRNGGGGVAASNGTQGNSGGSGKGTASAPGSGGGGGGAGAVGNDGIDGDNKKGGAGGDGSSSDITGTEIYYAGGGGGGAQGVVSGSDGRSSGGNGGGGSGGGDANNSSRCNGLPGTDGLGGGGGGGSAGSGNDNLGGGDGGDGIVIIRYLI